jgi:hypothetical protein
MRLRAAAGGQQSADKHTGGFRWPEQRSWVSAALRSDPRVSLQGGRRSR